MHSQWRNGNEDPNGHLELETKITEGKISLHGFNRRFKMAENIVSKLEYRSIDHQFSKDRAKFSVYILEIPH